MNLSDLAELTGKSISEVEAMLAKQDTVELCLSDKSSGRSRFGSRKKESSMIMVME